MGELISICPPSRVDEAEASVVILAKRLHDRPELSNDPMFRSAFANECRRYAKLWEMCK
jgi:hypothetical protein